MKIDKIHISILITLMNDPSTRSKDIANALKVPLSTIQRRRAELERHLLKKNYVISMKELGWRTAELFVSVSKGNSQKIANELLSRPNVISTSLRVGNPHVNVAAEIFFKDTAELHELVEAAKSMPNVVEVEWSEHVKVMKKEQSSVLNIIFKGGNT